jgi:hypothetical protein
MRLSSSIVSAAAPSLAACALFISALAAAQPQRAPIASNPVVTIEGKIQKVQIDRGQGMPFLELQSGEKTFKVYLGSIRYLMEQNFNPKAGTQASVKGYQSDSDITAITVTLAGEKKTLRLRDDNGYPLWRGGMMMRRMRRE